MPVWSKKTCLKCDILVRRVGPAQLYKRESHNFGKKVSELLTVLHTFPNAPPKFLHFMANRKRTVEEQVIFKLLQPRSKKGLTIELRSSQITLLAFEWASVNMLETLTPRSKTYAICWLGANLTRHGREEFHQQTAAQTIFFGGFLNDCLCEQNLLPWMSVLQMQGTF